MTEDTGIRTSCSTYRARPALRGARISPALPYSPPRRARTRSPRSTFRCVAGRMERWTLSRRGVAGEEALPLVERAGPSCFMGAAGVVVAQQRMGQRDFRPLGDGPQADLQARFAGILASALPSPGHDDALGP